MAITLTEARAQLQLALEAERGAYELGQSHSVGGRSRTEVDIDAISRRVDYWRREVARLEGQRPWAIAAFGGQQHDRFR